MIANNIPNVTGTNNHSSYTKTNQRNKRIVTNCFFVVILLLFLLFLFVVYFLSLIYTKKLFSPGEEYMLKQIATNIKNNHRILSPDEKKYVNMANVKAAKNILHVLKIKNDYSDSIYSLLINKNCSANDTHVNHILNIIEDGYYTKEQLQELSDQLVLDTHSFSSINCVHMVNDLQQKKDLDYNIMDFYAQYIEIMNIQDKAGLICSQQQPIIDKSLFVYIRDNCVKKT